MPKPDPRLDLILLKPNWTPEDIEVADRVADECSGIPDCCITFFSEVWLTRLVCTDEGRQRQREAKQLVVGNDLLYIPCDDCVAKRRFVTPRRCWEDTCFCDGWQNYSDDPD